jgi:hypothetical protein
MPVTIGKRAAIMSGRDSDYRNGSRATSNEGPCQWSEDELARIAGARKIWDEGKDPRGTLAEIYL